MYVPFSKSVDDVTFRFSLRHHFWPRLKKTMEHNLRSLLGEKKTVWIQKCIHNNYSSNFVSSTPSPFAYFVKVHILYLGFTFWFHMNFFLYLGLIIILYLGFIFWFHMKFFCNTTWFDQCFFSLPQSKHGNIRVGMGLYLPFFWKFPQHENKIYMPSTLLTKWE